MNKEDLSKVHVLVSGDAMIDRYWFGEAERLSPEAPVPVVRVKHIENRLGGAANVALNIVRLGARVSLFSCCGKDADGSQLEKLLMESGVAPCLSVDENVPTTVKLRIIGRQQQIVRCDFEGHPGGNALATQHISFVKSLSEASAVVLSDYHKGALDGVAAMIAESRSRGIPVYIDPKGSDWSRYRGATLITPNRAELRAVTGDWFNEEDLRRKAQRVRESLGLQYLLLTRSEEGMTLFSAEEEVNFRANAREVFDVSGAGDTVIAVLATLSAAGMPIKEAVRLANRAGGIVVGKLGTASVTCEELFSGE